MFHIIIVALVTDLLTPILIWKAGLPEEFRWLSHLALVAMMLCAYIRMLRQRYIPIAAWVVLIFSVLGGVMASLNGQALAATAWGWWMMFKYPLVGLYAYLLPRWPERFPERLQNWCVGLLCIEVIIQGWQYVTGETPGDNLAGTFGVNGTAHLVMLNLFVLAIALGNWISNAKLGQLAFVIGLGAVSSALGEMKFFPFAAGIMGALALAIRARHRLRISQVFLGVLVFAAILIAFPKLYNTIVPQSRIRPFSFYTNIDILDHYFTQVRPVNDGYDVGRNYILLYVWSQITTDIAPLLFGHGLGARGESRTIGVAGMSLINGDLGLSTGTSLAVIMGELGILGLIAVAGFIFWVIFKLWRHSIVKNRPDIIGFQYGLLLFTIMWPCWLWYSAIWASPVSMLLYWTALGYVWRHSRPTKELMLCDTLPNSGEK